MSLRGGFILLTVSMTLAVLAVLTYSLGKMSGLSARTEARAMDAERARLLAEAGLAHALRNMQMPSAAAMSGPTACAFNNSFTLGSAGTTTPYLSGGVEGVGTYTVGFIRQPNNSSGEPRPLLLSSIGTLINGAKHQIRLPLPTLSFALPGWTSTQAIAATAVPDEDTFVRSSEPWDGYYWSEYLEINGPTGTEERVLLHFNLAHFPGLTGTSRPVYARLGLYLTANESNTNTLTAHRITQNWNNNETSWYKRTSANSWTNNGGTHEATASGSMTFPANKGMRWMELNTELIGSWLSVGNNGLLLKASQNESFDFYSLNYNHWTNSDSTFLMRVPKLEIVYLTGC